MNYNKEAESLTFWRGSEVSQDKVPLMFRNSHISAVALDLSKFEDHP